MDAAAFTTRFACSARQMRVIKSDQERLDANRKRSNLQLHDAGTSITNEKKSRGEQRSNILQGNDQAAIASAGQKSEEILMGDSDTIGRILMFRKPCQCLRDEAVRYDLSQKVPRTSQ